MINLPKWKILFLILVVVILSSCAPTEREKKAQLKKMNIKIEQEKKAQLKKMNITIEQEKKAQLKKMNIKLYWFIPDGMRAEPGLFNIYQWAEEGKLPHIKKMMENGAYGFSIPVFPSHTPVNFATLLTGTYPNKHGIADGPMHTEGNPLSIVSVGGFRSVAKKIPPIWVNLEQSGKDVVLLSLPGSTPPELEKGITIRGRWGGWGADFHALIFQTKGDLSQRKIQGRSSRLFFFGPELTLYIDPVEAKEWKKKMPESYSPALEAKMSGWGRAIFGYVYDSTNDGAVNYDRIAFILNKNNTNSTLTILKQGEWSEWVPLKLKWEVENKSVDVHSDIKINVIKLDNDGFFRVRIFYNNINPYVVKPGYVSNQMVNGIGPMVDFADNFPPQLVFYKEDKQTFLDEANMSFQWHKKAVPFILNKYNPDAVIHDIYTPNQMLTSRWWLGYIDPKSGRYNEVTQEERDKLWEEVQWMYKELDGIVGQILKNKDTNTLVVLSSDHGAVPLNKGVRLNNLFAKEGLLKFRINPETWEPVIDWNNTKVIYLQMDNIYISPTGLAGKWYRSSGKDYEALRERVIGLLTSLTDEDGEKPLAGVVKWEDVEEVLDLPPDRVGDLVIANNAGYGWNEEMSQDLRIFETPLISGYKQAIFPQNETGMWTPFIIMGPGVKKGHFIEEPINMVDQYPTIMKLLNAPIPDFVDGRVLDEIFIK